MKKTRLSFEVGQALAEYGLPVLKSHTMQRVAYPTTASEGLIVFSDPSDAVLEIKAIKNA